MTSSYRGDVVQPISERGKRVCGCDVVAEHNARCAAVVRLRHGPEPLLTGGIPQL